MPVQKKSGNLLNAPRICLICHDFVSVNKEYNIKRHYETKHAEFMKLSGLARKDEAFRLAKSL